MSAPGRAAHLERRWPGFAGLIGVAENDITPPVGIHQHNWGAATTAVAEGVHRPLKLYALTLQAEAGGEPLVLIDGDMSWWRRAEDEWAIRGAVLEALGLDPSRLIFALAHSHAAPSITAADAEKPGGEHVEPYRARIRDAAIDAARRARADARPARLEWTTGRCDLAANRDLPEPGGDRIVCGYNPDAPADDTLLVGRAAARDGTPLATIVNYACHPTTLGPGNALSSPDYVGALRAEIERHTGGFGLFLMGAAGELAPPLQYASDPALADRHGRRLAHAALSALEGMPPPGHGLVYGGARESGAPLAEWAAAPREPSSALTHRLEAVELPLKDWPAADEFERQRRATDDPVRAERLRRRRDLRRDLGDAATCRMPLWVFRAGDALIAAQLSECYSWIQQALRARFPDHAVIWINRANGHLSYMAPAAKYDLDIYQVWGSPVARGGLERTEEAAAEAMRAVLA